MRAAFLIAFFLLSGCYNDLDYVTNQGMCFFIDDGVTLSQEEAEEVSEQFIALAIEGTKDSFTWSEAEVHDVLHRLTVWVEEFIGPRGYGWYYDDLLLIRVSFPDNLCQSAFMHELVHACLCELEAQCYLNTQEEHEAFPIFDFIDNFCKQCG